MGGIVKRKEEQNGESNLIQVAPVKTGPFARRNNESGPVLSGTFCIFVNELKVIKCDLLIQGRYVCSQRRE
jgi:hypothetical protein